MLREGVMMRGSVRRAAALAVSLGGLCLSLLLLTGCAGGDDLSRDFKNSGGGDTGFVAGDGSTLSISPEKRTDPVQFAGTAEDGSTISSKDTVGSVTVINFWYAGCAPCRAEAKDLAGAYDEFSPQGVKFVGVNTRDDVAQATQFAKEFGIAYPSIMDNAGGRAVQRAFAGQVPLNAVPTTLVLDTEGRVAHRVLGQLAGQSQLATLLKETLAESGSSAKSSKGSQ